MLAQGARDGARAVKEPVPEREPAAGRGCSSCRVPQPRSRRGSETHPRAEGSAEGRDPAGAEPSLQPLCHPHPPPPPGKGQGGGESATAGP